MSYEARQLRDNTLLTELLEETLTGILGAWEATGPEETAVRERLFFSYRATQEFATFMSNRIATAIAEAEAETEDENAEQ